MNQKSSFTKAFAIALTLLLLAIPFSKKVTSQSELVWEPTSGPDGGIVQALAVNDAGHVFAGT